MAACFADSCIDESRIIDEMGLSKAKDEDAAPLGLKERVEGEVATSGSIGDAVNGDMRAARMIEAVTRLRGAMGALDTGILSRRRCSFPEPKRSPPNTPPFDVAVVVGEE